MTSYSEKMLQDIANEDLAGANLNFHEALKNDDTDYLAELGETLFGMGFIQEAQQAFEILKKRQPENLAFNLSLAEIAIEENEIETAFEYLEAIPKENELYPQALLVIADLYQVLDIPEVSLVKLQEAATLIPDEPLISFAMAELNFSMNQFSEAAQLYEQLMQTGFKEISNISLNERLGSSLSMTGQFEESIPFLEAALKEEQMEDRLFQTAFVYVQLGESQKAINYLQQLRALNPQYQALYLYLAESLQVEEQLEEAQKVIEEGIHENPYQVDFYHFASENAYRLHDVKKAEEFLVQALETGEKVDETLLTLSNLYIKEGFNEEAVEAIKQMEEPENPYAQWNLAHAYNELEDYEAATKHYQAAAIELTYDADFLREYGLFLREDGQMKTANELFKQYLAAEPGDLEIQTLLDESFEE